MEDWFGPTFDPFYINSDDSSVRKGDTVIIFQYREDNTYQIAELLINDKDIRVLPLILYGSSQSHVPQMIPAPNYTNSLGSWISKKGFQQLRVAEIYKRPHVTTFFSGGIMQPIYRGEDRKVDFWSVPDNVAHLYPEMNASLVARAVMEGIESRRYKLIVCNFANVDATGHIGNVTAVRMAAECVDAMIGRIWAVCQHEGYVLFVTADHGNGEEDTALDGSPQLYHTVNNVPFIAVTHDFKIRKLRPGQAPFIGNVAASILKVLDIEAPPEMEPSILVPLENEQRTRLDVTGFAALASSLTTCGFVCAFVCLRRMVAKRKNHRPIILGDDEEELLESK
jgi:2,3-bisphosphoglycerate-independent phosphoglycerate mutase